MQRAASWTGTREFARVLVSHHTTMLSVASSFAVMDFSAASLGYLAR